MPKDRKKIYVNGLGDLLIRELEPSESDYFQNVGYLSGTKITIDKEVQEIWSEDGELIELGVLKEDSVIETALLQRSIDEINIIKDAENKVYAVRYCGNLNGKPYQYYCIEQARVVPKLELNYTVGNNPIPLTLRAIKKVEAYDIPLMYINEASNKLYLDNMFLWIDAKIRYNSGTTRVLDASGYARHGLASSTNIWQVSTAPYYFDIASTRNINFGNILNDDGSKDFVIECWIRFNADGVSHPIANKKSAIGDNTAGFVLYRKTDNKIEFKLSSGSASITITTTNAVNTNVWMHILVGIDRNGNGQIFINGASASPAVSVASIGSASNSLNYYIGRDNSGSTYSNISLAQLRHHLFPADSLPDLSVVSSAHYNAERAIYGL